MVKTFDFVVIGAGSGGLNAASFASQLGHSVAIVEKHRVGGDCTWTGCVPSKSLLKVAKVAHTMRTATTYGLGSYELELDMTVVRSYIRQAIADVYQYETPEQLRREGITVLTGAARFLDPRTIQVGDMAIRSKKFLLSTGAKPAIPPIPGLESVPYLTYMQLFENNTLPRKLIVLGAGPVGVEMAQAYRRLGSKVTIVDHALVPLEDRDAASVLSRVFAREGIQYVKGLATEVCSEKEQIAVQVDTRILFGDTLLLATGRRPNVEGMDLENAGVDYTPGGIAVNRSLRTSAKHIYAAGDCIGGRQLTHLAGWQGFQAARNALLPGNDRSLDKPVPSTIFTDPEVAHVGLKEEEAIEKYGGSVKVALRNANRNDRAVCENGQDGFLKIIYRPDGTIVGATIVGERAGEAINEFVLAMENGLKLKDMATAIHVYPSYSIDVMLLAADITMGNLVTGLSGTVVRQLCKIG